MRLVTLVSGGIDSIVMSILAAEEGHTLFPLFVDYGQLAKDMEWAACQQLHEESGLPAVRLMDLSGFGRAIPSGITAQELRVNEDAFLPGRNLLLILAGAAYAYSLPADAVALGIIDPSAHLFPDQTITFVDQCEDIVYTAMGARIGIVTPLIDLTKRDVLALARDRGVSRTYSCHGGTAQPCGRCISCLEIKSAQEGA